MPPVSVPRFAPLGDMALYFDGAGTLATATLPAAVFPTDPTDLAFTLAFWMSPGPAPWSAASGPPQAAGSAQAVIDIRGAGGQLIGLAHGPGPRLLCTIPGSAPDTTELFFDRLTARWQYVVVAYTQAQLTLLVTDAGPSPVSTSTALKIPLRIADEPRTLTLGRPVDHDPAIVPFQGMLTRLRLWRTALSPEDALHAGYVEPIGPRALQASSLAGDWRMNEGYGTTAFDYANPGAPLLPVRYQPPPGNHLSLGDGVPGTEPAWAVARLATLIRADTAQPMAALLQKGVTV